MTGWKADILIVEDDPAQIELLAFNVESAGYRAHLARTGAEAQTMIEKQEFDLVLLDWMLPCMSGIDLCKRIRSHDRFKSMPILIVTALGNEVDRIRGLESGADDYIVKPYFISEVLARIRAHLRRARPSAEHAVLRHKDIELDLEQHRVYRSKQAVKLGPTEFRILAVLIERPGRVWTRAQLLNRVWEPNVFVEDRTVDVHIARLRKALRRVGGSDPLRTVRGTGYALG